MQFNYYIKKKLSYFVALGFGLILTSCGSYQYVGYDNDGIYSDDLETNYEDARRVENETTTSNNETSTFNRSYFDEKAEQYSNIPNDERIIFTDIDSYSGGYYDENQDERVEDSYAGWGQANDNITINYIDYGWGFNSPWMWNRWGWNNWGWNAGFGWGWNNWGWNNWGWNAGFGWGWNNWGWNAGWGYNNFWCPPGFNGYYYNNRGLAFNNGRRGSTLAYRNRNTLSRRNNSNITRRNSSSTIRRGTTARRTSSGTRSRVRGNTTRSRSSSVRPRTNTRSRSNVNRSRSNSSRMSTSRGRSSSMRSSGSRSRSSGMSRSSSRGGSSRRR